MEPSTKIVEYYRNLSEQRRKQLSEVIKNFEHEDPEKVVADRDLLIHINLLIGALNLQLRLLNDKVVAHNLTCPEE